MRSKEKYFMLITETTSDVHLKYWPPLIFYCTIELIEEIHRRKGETWKQRQQKSEQTQEPL